MHNCKDIVWANYPFTSHTAKKHRPAVLISGKNSHGDYICLPITSTKTKKSLKLDSTHLDGQVDLRVLRLISSSYISFEQPMTLDAKLFDISKEPIARLTDETYKEVIGLFKEMEC